MTFRLGDAMRNSFVLLLLLLLHLMPHPSPGADAVADQHAVASLKEDKPRLEHNTHPDAQWFGQGNLGLFVHWGLSSVSASNDLSWAMMANIWWNHNPPTPEQYYAQADRFNPTQYDPDQWLKAASEAGFTYAVLTTRHHDGYALWPSRYGEMNVGLRGPKYDLVKPYVEACRRHHLKVGFYYSPQDWYFDRKYRSFGASSKGTPESPHLGMRHEPVTLPERTPEFLEQQKAYTRGQIEELLTNYGKIDLLWFDGGTAGISLARIRELQPGIIINNRSELPPDFDASFEANLPKDRPSAEWWEACQTAVSSWGYIKDHGDNPKPAAAILSVFIQVRAWGGNFLINFAPRADGTMPEAYYTRMKEIGDWMRDQTETVKGAKAGGYPESCNVPMTVAQGKAFLFALPDYKGTNLTLSSKAKPESVRLRRRGSDQQLAFSYADGKLAVTLPAELRSTMPDVVEVRF
jgi:alpha-L-fucosidase